MKNIAAEKKRKPEKLKFSIIAIVLIACLMISGISAYFTDADTVTNTFTIGKISINLQEPNWDAEDGEDLAPNEEVVKDPQIYNDGVNPAFVFTTVAIPYANIKTSESDGTVNDAANTQLFTLLDKDGNEGINDGWYLVGYLDDNGDLSSEVVYRADGTVVHVYAYGDADGMTSLEAGSTTAPVFSSVRFCNSAEDQGLETTTQDIVINAYGIQTLNISDTVGQGNSDGSTDPETVWKYVYNASPVTDDKDNAAPVLTLTTNSWSNENSVVLSGAVTDESEIASAVVTIGNTKYTATVNDNGTWTADVMLSNGVNDIDVVVTDTEGNSTTENTSIICGDFHLDDDGGLSGAIPPNEEPDTPDELPKGVLPSIIEFTGGQFDVNSTYTPGTYEEVSYETTYTKTKYPVAYQNILWSKWLLTIDTDGSVLSTEAYEIAFPDIDIYYSTYIVYDFETAKYLKVNNVAGDSVELWAIYDEADDTLENAVYLAAYLNKVDGDMSHHIAMWDGTQYVPIEYDESIAAVTEFTETYTVTSTKTVQITAPSSSTEYTYVPMWTLNAEEGMTWEEWLASDYNTIGLVGPTIRDMDYNVVSYDTEILANESYSLTIEYEEFTITASNRSKIGYDEDAESQDLVIPSTFYDEEDGKWYKVTNIGSGAFTARTNLTSVEIPAGVTSLGQNTFLACSNLTSVSIPDGVSAIAYQAFAGCSSLTSVTIPNGVTSIGERAFGGCSSLTSVTIPNSVTSIGNYAFRSAGLKYVTLGSGLTKIGNGAFMQCKMTSVTIPDSVTAIYGSAFNSCTSLKSVTIGSGVTEMGLGVFRSCSNLSSVTFKNTNGWWYSDSSVATSGTDISADDLANTSRAATYLRSTYLDYFWYRSDVTSE